MTNKELKNNIIQLCIDVALCAVMVSSFITELILFFIGAVEWYLLYWLIIPMLFAVLDWYSVRKTWNKIEAALGESA